MFDEFIHSFLFQAQREGLINMPAGMEIHWFNGLYNLYCAELELPAVEDPHATANLSDHLTRRFFSSAPLHINVCTILRRMSAEWSDLLVSTLEHKGFSSWLTGTSSDQDNTAVGINALDNRVFKVVNSLMGTTENRPLSFLVVCDFTAGRENFHLKRHREKILAWVTHHFSSSGVTEFVRNPGRWAPNRYIGTIDHVYFGVFDHDQPCHTEQQWPFSTDHQSTLQLPHLLSVDFSSWPKTISQALLLQAMEQTHRAEDIALFFLDSGVRGQLGKIPQPVIQMLSNQLSDKLVCNNSTFQEVLLQEVLLNSVCDHLASAQEQIISPEVLLYLFDTPLLEPVLLALRQRGMDISQVIHRLNSWQISDFSKESIKQLLTLEDCQRLFGQAISLKQGNILECLILTGHCNQSLLNISLFYFAKNGFSAGLTYLLKTAGIDPNLIDDEGRTPLFLAAGWGQVECLRNWP